MMKHEFEELARIQVDEKTYKDIETVYMYYPNMEVKEQIVGLYRTYGMVIISDMLPRAMKIKELVEKKSEIETQIRDLNYLTKKTLEIVDNNKTIKFCIDSSKFWGMSPDGERLLITEGKHTWVEKNDGSVEYFGELVNPERGN